MPTRVIDVETTDSVSTVKLVEVEEGAKGQYVALSYCWGAATNRFTTTRSSLSARKAGILVSDLPVTFQDAVAMARILGVRYVWIDSICICQDDLADWERESARMATVYSNAYLTIAATGQSDNSGGLFFERPSRTYLRLPLQTTNGIKGCVLVFPLNKAKEFNKSYRTQMHSQPLAKRAWAFQERVLARRVIHFASDQISFECLEGSQYEDGLQLTERYFSIYLKQPKENVDGAKDTLPSRPLAQRQSSMDDSPEEHWYSLLRVYGSLELTYPADKLPALAGIAKVFSQLLDDEYVAGIWRKSMIEGLCWQSMRCKAVSGYRAPSWSWASVDGVPATMHQKRIEWDPVAVVLDCHVEIDGDNPFGRVKSGWIEIEAPLVPLILSRKKEQTKQIFLKTERGDESGARAAFDTIDRTYEASAHIIREMKLFALVLAAWHPDVNHSTDREVGCRYYQTLIVSPVEAIEAPATSVGLMKRVGWMIQDARLFGANELNDSRDIVTLV
jgi:hypothetical protein